ncbi:hypothetical protein [Granulicella paludicola]|uniref:hypothetical protein n=1 Tax=Granulicella paludicola TaxID=474951 RepID=UPI0021DFF4C2|nr:hypothetical protein [Granulicella paludicola]
MSKCLRCVVTISLLALNLNARAIALIPTKIRNDCPISVRIVVIRFANCLGPERSKSGDWTSETTLSPRQDGTLLLMGGAHGLCSGGVRSITIETLPTAAGAPGAPAVLPLSITNNFPDHWLYLHVQIDPRSHRFILRAANDAQ